MPELRIVVVPVGRLPLDELEGALGHVVKAIGKPVELREPAPLPREGEDPSRGQFEATRTLAALRRALPGLKVAKLVGASASGAPVPTPAPDAVVCVTDVDVFTPAREGVFGELDPPHRVALLSVRRLREAFYRRPANPARQRARLAKQVLRAVGLLAGLGDCADATCAMAPAQTVMDLDRKRERYCAACWRRLTTGAIRP